MALSLQDEDSVLQLLHRSLKQVVLLHHGTKAMLQLSLSVRQHFDLQRDESWLEPHTLQEAQMGETTSP